MMDAKEKDRKNKIKSLIKNSGYPYGPLQELIGEIVLATHFSKDENESVRFHRALKAIFGSKQKSAIRKDAEHEKNLYFVAQLVVIRPSLGCT